MIQFDGFPSREMPTLLCWLTAQRDICKRLNFIVAINRYHLNMLVWAPLPSLPSSLVASLCPSSFICSSLSHWRVHFNVAGARKRQLSFVAMKLANNANVI